MTFLHPWLLLLALFPFLWVAYSWRLSMRRLPLALKGLSLAAILVALAQPVVTLPERRTGVVVLVDTSRSISPSDLTRAASIARQIDRHKGRNWVRIVPFDSRTRPLAPQDLAGDLHFTRVADSVQTIAGTNLEAALTDSMAAIPANYLPRLLLVSDGNENEGSSLRAIAQLQKLRVPVDTIPLAGTSNSALQLESVSLPREAYSAEQVPVDLTLESQTDSPATADIYAEGKLLGHESFHLKPGLNQVRVHARVKSSGVVLVSGRISTDAGGTATFETPLELKQAEVLYLSQDPSGSDNNLLAAFRQANFNVARDASELDKDLDRFQLLVLNNLDLGSLTSPQKARIENYVKNGGGLLLIGGERQVYKEDKKLDALDRALPAKLAPPDTPHGTCVALIIDKSSSMEGRKIELARLSAIGVVDHLRPQDSIGVLIFDNSFQWAVPMRHAEDKSLIKRLISGITPDGGTQIAPALAEAYRHVLPSRATYKHVVLLTDGISEEGDSMELAKEAAAHQVTISTVGLGQDVNRTYLEKVADTSGGKSYFLNEPVGLEQILLKDVQTYTGTTAVEKPLTPIVLSKSDVLEGVGMETAPPLKGYARFEAKPGAETLLALDEAKKDPLYTRWQYGLGRAAVFSSDAKSRWAEAWVTWRGFDKFWINLSRDLLKHTDESEASAEFDPANGDMTVRYRLAAGAPEPKSIPEIFAVGPSGFRQPIEVEKIAAGQYEGRLHVGSQTGLFRVRPVNDSHSFPEVGLYRRQPELQDRGSNQRLLRQISSLTNGRFDPSLNSVFSPDGRTAYVNWQLWPLCIALAIALTIAELVTRKWRGLTDRFRRA